MESTYITQRGGATGHMPMPVDECPTTATEGRGARLLLQYASPDVPRGRIRKVPGHPPHAKCQSMTARNRIQRVGARFAVQYAKSTMPPQGRNGRATVILQYATSSVPARIVEWWGQVRAAICHYEHAPPHFTLAKGGEAWMLKRPERS